MEVIGQYYAHTALLLGKNPGIHWTKFIGLQIDSSLNWKM